MSTNLQLAIGYKIFISIVQIKYRDDSELFVVVEFLKELFIRGSFLATCIVYGDRYDGCCIQTS